MKADRDEMGLGHQWNDSLQVGPISTRRKVSSMGRGVWRERGEKEKGSALQCPKRTLKGPFEKTKKNISSNVTLALVHMQNEEDSHAGESKVAREVQARLLRGLVVFGIDRTKKERKKIQLCFFETSEKKISTQDLVNYSVFGLTLYQVYYRVDTNQYIIQIPHHQHHSNRHNSSAWSKRLVQRMLSTMCFCSLLATTVSFCAQPFPPIVRARITPIVDSYWDTQISSR